MIWRATVRKQNQLVLSFVFLLLPMTGIAFTAPVIWGTDEDTGRLVKIENYDSTPVVTDYGKLSINCDGIVNLLDQALLALHWLETN